MKIQITKVPNSRAEGGWLSHTHGAIFDSGVDWINEGGSHEENPYGGVMVGSDEQGIPNLVEEDEAIWNGDYVFSKRMKVPKKLAKKYNLGGDMTFADAVKKLTKESEERPLDKIARNTQDYILGEFADTQEEMRAAKAQRAMEKEQQLRDDFLTGFQYGLGGHMSPVGLVPNADNISPFELAERQLKDGGNIHIKEKNKGKFTEQAKNAGMGVQEFASHVLANKDDYSSSTVRRANFAHVFGGRNYAFGGPFGNVFEGTGNKPNTLNLNPSDQSFVRRLFGNTGFTRFMENASSALSDPINYFAGDEIENVMSKLATMTEPEMEKFFNTDVGQVVAKAITTLDSMPTSSAQEAGVQRWMKSTGRLAKPVYQATVNAAKRAMAQSKLNARGQMKVPKGGGKPKVATETKTPLQVAQESLPAVKAQRDARFPAVRGSSEVAPIIKGGDALAPISTPTTGVSPFTRGITEIGFPVQPTWNATVPFWGGLGIAAGNLMNWKGEPEVDGVTGETILTNPPSAPYNGVVGIGTNKSNRFLNEPPVTSNRKKGNRVTAAVLPISAAPTRELDKPDSNIRWTPDPTVISNPQIGKLPTGTSGTSVTTTETGKFKPRQTWMRDVPWMMSGAMGLKEMLTPADYGNANMILDAAYRMGQPISIGTEYVGDYRKRSPFNESYYTDILNQRGAAADRYMMNLSGGNRAIGMAGIATNDLTNQMALAELGRQSYLANRADDAQVADFNYRTNKGNADTQNQRNQFLAQLNNTRQQAMLSGVNMGARLRQAIKDQRDAAIYGNLSNFAQGLGDIGWENSQYNMIGGLADEDVLKYMFDKDFITTYKNRLNKRNIGEG